MPLLALPFPAIDPVLIAIGPFAIRWYALAYIAGIVLGWRLVRRLVQRPGWAADARSDRRPRLLRHAGRHPGRAHRLRAVLSAGPLSHPALGHAGRLARRHVLPWRPDRRAGRDLSVRAAPRLRLLRADRRPGGGHADRTVPRPDRQLHQRRAVGAGHRPALGRGLPHRRAGAAPSQPALRGGAGGPAPVRGDALVRAPPLRPADPWPAQRRLPDRLRAGADHGRSSSASPTSRSATSPAGSPWASSCRCRCSLSASSWSCARGAGSRRWGERARGPPAPADPRPRPDHPSRAT